MGHEAGRASRERRRLSQTVRFGLLTLLFGIALGAKAGFVLAGLLCLCLLGAAFGAVYVVVLAGRIQEGRRRRSGRVPSWPGSIYPATYRHSGHATFARDVGQLGGRVSLVEGRLRWDPADRIARHFQLEPLSWDVSSIRSVDRIWGPGQQGRITIVTPAQETLEIWVRNVKDLRAHLDLPVLRT
jgi:hypothetical protein